ncbi:hypothetical protein RHS01_08480 [Rhizoctonia solani]|uniref:Uncharacterized protein n=1 Tax=Rhizoctonia solani TaxID=456999 RepID=A0A8H7I5P9_9AGAM|nr:hypothetical protein RHS01_08480 [Rhizoctonia solani]
MTLEKCSWSALECSPSNPDPSDPNEEVPEIGTPWSAPEFLGPRGVVTVILLATTRSLFLVGEDRGMLLDNDPRVGLY